MRALAVMALGIATSWGCSSKKADPPTPCAKYAALYVSCARFTGTLKNETEVCEALVEITEAGLDLTNESDYSLVSRVRRAKHGVKCASTATDCATLEACMQAAEKADPPLPDPPPANPPR